MGLIAHKFLACIVLAGLFLANMVCACADSERTASAVSVGASGRAGEEQDGDHDQDHHDHSDCKCVTTIVYVADETQIPHFKLGSAPLLHFFMEMPLALTALQGLQMATVRGPSGHPPAVESTLLRLHCALIV